DRLVTVLDVGTGGADIPRAVVRRARRAGRHIRVFALDRAPATLRIATEATRKYPEITFLRGDALSLPIRPGAVDLVISAMTLHHLEPDPAGRYLSEMDGAARVGFVVNDLVRTRLAHAVVWLITRFITRSAISRHDGPLSGLGSYTPPEGRGVRAVREGGSARGLGRVSLAVSPALRGAGQAVTAARVDVVVVGAGPAGSAAAILLAERGW